MKKMRVLPILFVTLVLFSQTVLAEGIFKDDWFPLQCHVSYDNNGIFQVQFGPNPPYPHKHPIYLKEQKYIMIPLKEIMEASIYRSICNEEDCKEPHHKVILKRNLEEHTNTLFWEGNTIIFFEGKRDVVINGTKKYLATEPCFTEDEIYICTKDVPMLFQVSWYHYREIEWKGEYIVSWIYSGGKDTEDIAIREMTSTEKTYFLESGENHSLTGVNRITTYIKEHEMMIAVRQLNDLSMPVIQSEPTWDPEEQTVSIKTWGDIGKNIVIKAGSDHIFVDGQKVALPVTAEMMDGHLYIPLVTWLDIIEIPKEKQFWNEDHTEVEFILKNYIV